MRGVSSLSILLFVVIAAAGIALAYSLEAAGADNFEWVIIATLLVGLAVSSAIKIATPWDRAVVLRLGQFRGLRGPGMFSIVPIVDTVAMWIDTRVNPTAFSAEKTLTKDTVPVDVDAVLFWQVVDPEKAALGVTEYTSAIGWAARTALRDVIGKTPLSDLLEGRETIGDQLERIIDERTEPWGIKVLAVEVKDILIPAALQDAMSMQAQAERERQARVILGDSEKQVAAKFGEAARTYANDPVALHLRAMNMLYEGLKKNATIILVPSTALESMQLGAVAGFAAQPRGGGHDGPDQAAAEAVNPSLTAAANLQTGSS